MVKTEVQMTGIKPVPAAETDNPTGAWNLMSKLKFTVIKHEPDAKAGDGIFCI